MSCDIKEYHRLYRIANKDKLKEYRDGNKDKRKEYNKAYVDANKATLKEKQKVYSQTPQGKKNHTMTIWRHRGVNNVNDEMYDRYINTHCCDVCKNEFKNSKHRHLDHDHTTGEFRQVLCQSCNNMDKWKNYI